MMRRVLFSIPIILLIAVSIGVGLYHFNQYWIYRYDTLITRQSGVYNLDPNLVWSLIWEETYFRTTVIGDDKEIGLMQVTPTVARIWAKETGLKEFEKESVQNVQALLSEPERNIQIGSWYLQKVRTPYRDLPAEKALMLAAYNAGPSRVEDWTDGKDLQSLTEQEFIGLIRISTTKAYVSSILKRFRENRARLTAVDLEKQKKQIRDNSENNNSPKHIKPR